MSDDKNPKNQGTGDGTGPQSGTGSTEPDKATTFGFGELMGAIDTRIETAVRNVLGKGGASENKTDAAAPESVAQQVRNELAKLNGEEAAKQKDADRDVTIQQLQEQVTKLEEGTPAQSVSKLTQLMWGGRKKS